MTLEVQEVGLYGACMGNADCAGLLAFYGVVGATSLVVSGSISIIGNVMYWLEEQGQCARAVPDVNPPDDRLEGAVSRTTRLQGEA